MGCALLGSILILTLFLKSTHGQHQEQSIPNSDEYFISQFFEQMGINSSKRFDFYNLSSSVCSWQFVFCDAKQQNVIGLVAPNLGLYGPIPDNTIGKLKKLQFLDLNSNRISDFSSDFWSLISLKSLNLSNNNFSINLSTNIGNFGSLEKLDFSFNNFTGNLPDSFSSLASLQVLNLNRNRFDSIIPLSITNCHSLTSVDLSMNSLHGSLPQGFDFAFPKLKSLNLAANLIKGKGSEFSKMVSLNYLNISKNLFKGSVVEIFSGPLEVIDLSSNHFEGHISQVNFSSSFDWSHLIHLDLSDNEISGMFFSNLTQAHNLKHLNLAKNRFSKQSFIQINELHNLEYLNVSETNMIGQISNQISKLYHLKTVDLSNNHLVGKIPLLTFKTLQNLDLSNNNLTGDIPLSLLQKLPWMERFNFSYNNLTLCDSQLSLETLKSAFIGSTNSCPIAANPTFFKKKLHKHRGLKLALSLAITLIILLVALLFFAFGCRNKTRMWDVKEACNEENIVSGPFSFKTDSTTWVADVKVASSVPVVIFEKPLLNFTFSDLLSATSNFNQDTLLAEGRFGPIYRGFLGGSVHVAITVLVHGSTMTDEEAAAELMHLGRIKNPNLVPLMGYCLAGEQRIAIYDYMENGNLQNLLYDLPLRVHVNEDWSNDTWEDQETNDDNDIQNVGSEALLMTWWFRHKIGLGTARALAFLHHGCSPPIIHRDVKTSSVYLDYNFEPRLSDSGLSKIFGNKVCVGMALGSPGYASPDGALSPKSDVYGFGVVLLELITGKKPVGDVYTNEDNSKAQDLVSWVRGLVRMNRGSLAIDPKIRDTGDEGQMVEGLKIGYLCTADLPSKRPSMQQVVGLLKDIEPV